MTDERGTYAKRALVALVETEATRFEGSVGACALERRARLPERLRPKGRMVGVSVSVLAVTHDGSLLECGFRSVGSQKVYSLSPGDAWSLLKRASPRTR